MIKMPFGILYLIGLAGAYLARVPPVLAVNRTMTKEDRKSTRQKFQTEGILLGISMLMWFLATQIVPLIYIFTHWLDFADYNLPIWVIIFGFIVFLMADFLLYCGHRDLGKNWSSTVQIQKGQSLVTEGVYKHIRHPIYAAHWLWGVAQVLMLPNWLAGWGGLLLFALIYILRVPNEEKMMIAQFGDAYRRYMQSTGGVIPKFTK